MIIYNDDLMIEVDPANKAVSMVEKHVDNGYSIEEAKKNAEFDAFVIQTSMAGINTTGWLSLWDYVIKEIKTL